jgi:hypothetical protein
MVTTSQLILDEVAFVADINPTDIQDGNLSELNIGLKWANSDATAVTIAGGLAQLSLFRVYNNGLKTEIRGAEIFALNCLKMGNIPWALTDGAVAHNRGYIAGLVLPVNKSQGSKAQIQAVFAANAHNELSTLAVHAKYKDHLETPLLGYQRKPLTTAVLAAFGNRISLALQGAKITGLLLWSTTVPVVGATTTTLHKIRLLNSKGVLTEYNWADLAPAGNNITGNASFDAILANYRYVKLDEPIPADDIIADIYADDANPIVVIPEYQFG